MPYRSASDALDEGLSRLSRLHNGPVINQASQRRQAISALKALVRLLEADKPGPSITITTRTPVHATWTTED